MQSRFLSRITADSNQNRRRGQILSAHGREASVYICVCMFVFAGVCVAVGLAMVALKLIPGLPLT